jgi:chitodextrinase
LKKLRVLLITVLALLLITGTALAEGVPSPSFTAYPHEGFLPLNVAFQDTSSNEPISWLWEFGDGSNSTEQNPVHSYTLPGTYNVSLSVGNIYGNDTLTEANYVTVYLGLPKPNMTYTPAAGPAPLTVFFNSSNSTGLVDEVYNWSFGDGTTSTEANPTHVYQNEGSYTIVLRITNPIGTNLTYQMNAVNASNTATWYSTISGGQQVSQDGFWWLTAFAFLGLVACIPCEWILRQNEWKYVYKFGFTLFSALLMTYLGLTLFTDNILNQYNGVAMQNVALGLIYLVGFAGTCWISFGLNIYDYYKNAKLDEAVDKLGNYRK